MQNNNLQTGVTLIELVFSLAVASVLVLCLLSLLLLTQKNLARVKAQQQIFDQARHVELIFRSAIEQAGYLGCNNLDNQVITVNIPLNNSYPIGLAIQGFNSPENTPLSDKTKMAIKTNTDLLTLEALSSKNSFLNQAVINQQPILLLHDLTAADNSLMLISDCASADLFNINRKISNNFPHPQFTHLYDTNSHFGVFNITTFFIRASHYFYNNDQPIYALYKNDLVHNSAELVAGISDLKITYSTDGEDFLTADNVNNWRAVKKVKIIFISEASLANYIIQQPFTLIIPLRNRL